MRGLSSLQKTDVALTGFMFLVSECKKTAGRIEHSAPDAEAAPSPQDSAKETKKLALKTTLSDEDLAQEFIQQSMEKLRVSDLRVFREACQHLLTWWESDRGQVHSLMIEQHGDVNSAAGRMTIIKKRDRMNQRILQPFKEGLPRAQRTLPENQQGNEHQ